jgi:ABC-type antimicrobial peptide transport system permease subunit
MITNYLKIAWRTIRKNYTISLINIFGLSVGMTAAVFILLWVKNELSYDSYHADAGRIYRLTDTIPVNKSEHWLWENSPFPLLAQAQASVPGIEAAAQLKPAQRPLVLSMHGSLLTEKKAAYVGGGWFEIFHYEFTEGNAAGFNASPYNLILTASAARKYFGSHPALGQTLSIDSITYQVKGVVKDYPSNSSFRFNLLLPVAALLTDPGTKREQELWGNFNTITFLKLRKTADRKAISRQLSGIMDRNRKDNEVTIGLLPLKDMYFETGLHSSSLQHGNRNAVYVFSVMALLLLITASINYVNLTTARAGARAKETGTRRMIGAARWHLFGQFMTEALLLSFIALAVTLLLLRLCLPLFNNITGKEFLLPFTDGGMWLVLAGTLLVAVLLNGIYPALLLSSFKPLSVFRGNSLLNLKDAHFRKGLVIMQFVISIVLITGAIVIYRQLQYVQRNSAGYDRSQIMTLELPWYAVKKYTNDMSGFNNMLKQELLSQSSIEGVTATNGSVIQLRNMSSGSADWNGRAPDFNPVIAVLAADESFASLFNLRMKEGRWFMQGSIADSNNVILNETAVKVLGIQKPVPGQRFTVHGTTGTVIGVVKDFTYTSMHEKIGPMVIRTMPNWYGTLFIKIRPGQIPQAVSQVAGIWKQLLPGRPLEYTFMDEDFNHLYKADLRVSTLVLIFSVIAIIIASLGLFGLVAFTAEQRRKEIGIRKILGASVSNIVGLLSRSFLLQLVLAALIAFPLAYWAMSRWLQNFAYRISFSWWILAAAAAIAIFIALATVSLQALKAAVANPVKSLRTE